MVDLAAPDLRRILLYLQTPAGDPLSCVFARLHYFRESSPIPKTPINMAAYAKRHYNTALGSATAADYLSAYERYWNA